MRDTYIIMAMAIALAAACGMAFADSTSTTSAPSLQISSYSTTPTTVYANTLGYLQITLSNTGTATADSVTAYYTFDGVSQSLAAGEISSGSSADLTIPFKISPSSAGSIQVVTVEVLYSYDSGSGVSNKKTALSVPLMVQQQNPLEVRTVNISSSSIGAGETVALELELENTGGVVNNLEISMPSNSTFAIEGTTKRTVGTIPANSSKVMELDLVSSSSTSTGTYNVPVTFTYQDALGQPTEDTLYVGPVSVVEGSTQYRLSLEPLAPVEIGSQVDFNLTLENAGTSPVSATIEANSTSVFTPIGVNRIYFDSVPAGGKASKTITLGVGASTSSGYYTLPLKLTTSNGQSATFDTGVYVSATPEITLTLDTSGTTTDVEIANTGNSQIRSVYASAQIVGSSTKAESFIGTLNVDDFSTLELSGSTASAGGMFGSTTQQIEVVIRFKDSDNIERVMNKTLDAETSSSSQSYNVSSAGAAAANQANSDMGPGGQGGGNALSMLLGPAGRSGSSSTASSSNLILVGGAFIVVIAGVLAYKFYWLKRKKPAEAAGAAKQDIVEAIKSRMAAKESKEKKK